MLFTELSFLDCNGDMMKIDNDIKLPLNFLHMHKIRFNPFSLAFQGEYKHLEETFKENYYVISINYIRVSILIGFFFYSIFGILDAVTIPAMRNTFWFIRFGVVSSFASFVFLFSFSKYFKKYMQVSLSAMITVAGLGIVAMIIIGPPSVGFTYYAGLALVLIYGYTLLRIRFLWATLSAIIIIVSYEIAAIWLIHTPRSILISNNFFFLTTNMFGMIACYAIEYYTRKSFFLAFLLEKRKKEIKTINSELEVRIQERTSRLEETNSQLKLEIKEREQAEKQLLRTEKMAALGDLVAGVAHEISTPLGVGVLSASFLWDITREYSDNLESEILKRSELEKYIHDAIESSSMILSNLKRAADLLNSFKQVAVDQSGDEQRSFNIKTYIDEILISLHPKYKRTGHTIDVFCPETLEIDSFPGAFSQILTNLIMNSLIHGFNKVKDGKIKLDISVEKDNLMFQYNDNGRGMGKEVLEKMYDPFFTTARNQGGTGLGMHIVYNLVTQKLKGEIECESSPGNGASFLITFPLTSLVILEEHMVN